jgi:hypothetical protein
LKRDEVLDRIDEIVPSGTIPPVRIHAAGLGGVFEDLDHLRIEQPRDI